MVLLSCEEERGNPVRLFDVLGSFFYCTQTNLLPQRGQYLYYKRHACIIHSIIHTKVAGDVCQWVMMKKSPLLQLDITDLNSHACCRLHLTPARTHNTLYPFPNVLFTENDKNRNDECQQPH